MRRRVLLLSSSAAVFAAASLTSCAAPLSANDLCTPAFSVGALSASVTVSGETANELQINVGKNIQTFTAQRSVVGSENTASELVIENDIVAANLAYVNATTGELLQVSQTFGTGSADSFFLANAGAGEIVAGTLCAREGDTLAIALSPQESIALGVVDGNAVVITEIVEVFRPRAEGTKRALPNGFPAVTTDHTGRPGIVLPPQQPPTETRSAVRIQGTGEKVQADDQVIGHILDVSWSGQIEQNSWTTGPTNFGSEADIVQTQATFRSALTGVPVGSQVVVIEPTADGARVSVIDVLAVA